MKIKIKGHDFHLPLVTWLIIFISLCVQFYATYLKQMKTPPYIKRQLEIVERNYKNEKQMLDLEESNNAYYQQGQYNKKQYDKKIKALNKRYQKISLVYLKSVPLYKFYFRFGAVEEKMRTGWDEFKQRSREGLFNLLWFGGTLISSQYVHGGWEHFLGNMLFLFLFGMTIESETGSIWFLIFYHIGGAVAGLVQFAAMPGSSTFLIGASGSISAVMGAYLIVAPTAKISLGWIFGIFGFIGKRVSAALFLFVWIFLQIKSGLAVMKYNVAGGVAVWAHIGGFSIGILWFMIRDLLPSFD